MDDSDFFTDSTTDSSRIWTAGFLNERFIGPVSPLGWTLIRDSLEELALREPLHYLGVDWPESRRLTRLYRGHPYTDAEVFWTLYKLFPDFLLPEDAVRYFPHGDVGRRKSAPQLGSLWSPRVWCSLGRAALKDPANWSPWHNWKNWRRFETCFIHELSALEAQVSALEAAQAARHSVRDRIRDLLDRAQRLNQALLRRHRWSLIHAELTYTLLRHLLGQWVKGPSTDALAARLVSGVPNLSVAVDRDLAGLRELRGRGSEFERAWQAFLEKHGHRSLNLDIRHPPFAEAPQTALTLFADVPKRTDSRPLSCLQEAWNSTEAGLTGPTRGAKCRVLRHLVGLARRYMGLREDQRYRWQQGLALVRRLVMIQGRQWAERGLLGKTDDVFFVTWDELRDSEEPPTPGVIAARQSRFETLESEFLASPSGDYPAFLQGDVPLPDREHLEREKGSSVYWGRAASPGTARGAARRVVHIGQLSQVAEGEVLVALSTDPGWTPVFGRIAALVTEVGGLLSHGAVVAREYGLPAVVAVPDILSVVQDGQLIEVDGTTGRISLLDRR